MALTFDSLSEIGDPVVARVVVFEEDEEAFVAEHEVPLAVVVRHHLLERAVVQRLLVNGGGVARGLARSENPPLRTPRWNYSTPAFVEFGIVCLGKPVGYRHNF